jgi:hypothetical protein
VSDLHWLPGNYKFSEDFNSLEFASMMMNAEAEVREPAHVEVQRSEGVPLATNAAPAPVKGTTSIELIDMAESATTAVPKALEAWSGNKAGCRLCMAL